MADLLAMTVSGMPASASRCALHHVPKSAAALTTEVNKSKIVGAVAGSAAGASSPGGRCNANGNAGTKAAKRKNVISKRLADRTWDELFFL